MPGLLLIHGKMWDRVTDNEYQVGFLSRGTEALPHRWVMNEHGLVHLYSDLRLGNGPPSFHERTAFFFFPTCQHLGENGLKGTLALCKGWVPFGLMWRVRVHIHRWELCSAAIAQKDGKLYSVFIYCNTSTLSWNSWERGQYMLISENQSFFYQVKTCH